MAHSYLPCDRDQAFLLPPDIREWLPSNHLAWFVLEVVGKVDTSGLHVGRAQAGPGRRAYDPEMLLALLVYSYCTGVRSSRQIERLCEVDVAFRVTAANWVPDHSTIARFRSDYQEQVVDLFTQVLALCAQAGLATVGVVAVDSTKMGAAASLSANRSRAQLKAEVRAMLAEAEQTDASEDACWGERRGDELPPELSDPATRRRRIEAALVELETRARAVEWMERAPLDAYRERKETAAAEAKLVSGRRPRGVDRVAEAEQAVAVHEARERGRRQVRAGREAANAAAGVPMRGPKPSPEEGYQLRRARRRLEEARAQAETTPVDEAAPPRRRAHLGVNLTDPDSRVMKTRSGFIQGYTAAAAVNEQGVVLACAVSSDVTDYRQAVPMMEATLANVGSVGVGEPVGVMLFDAGYWSEANATAPGPDRLIATKNGYKLRGIRAEHGPRIGPPPLGARPAQAMEHRLLTAEGAALYAKRGSQVEPFFGTIKEARGYRRFIRRGLKAVDSEWHLICATANLLKLWRHRPHPA